MFKNPLPTRERVFKHEAPVTNYVGKNFIYQGASMG
jgi:hypothetical protein